MDLNLADSAAFARKQLLQFAKEHGANDPSDVADRLRDRASVVERDGQPAVVITDSEGNQQSARDAVTKLFVSEPSKFRARGPRPSEPNKGNVPGLSHSERMKLYLQTRAETPEALGLSATKLRQRNS